MYPIDRVLIVIVLYPSQLAEMERDRILELGSTLEHNVTFAEHNEGHKRGNRESAAGDLLSTITMSASVQDMRSVGTEVQDAWCVSTASMVHADIHIHNT